MIYPEKTLMPGPFLSTWQELPALKKPNCTVFATSGNILDFLWLTAFFIFLFSIISLY
jgi:hypothetical protein